MYYVFTNCMHECAQSMSFNDYPVQRYLSFYIYISGMILQLVHGILSLYLPLITSIRTTNVPTPLSQSAAPPPPAAAIRGLSTPTI